MPTPITGSISFSEINRELQDDCNTSRSLGTDSIRQLACVTTVNSQISFSQLRGKRTLVITNENLYMWGVNSDGWVGNNTTAQVSCPVQIGSFYWTGIDLSGLHTIALETDINGTNNCLKTWGQNSSGQLGTNDTVRRSSPVQTVSGGTDWKRGPENLSAGRIHTGAIKTNGTLWVWGGNATGQLGTNDVAFRSSPVQTVSGGNNWKQFVTNGTTDISTAIKTDGTLWVWGCNFSGELGTNDTVNRSSPVQTVSGGTNWYFSAAGTSRISAIKTDGTLWVWGFNGGVHGTNDITNRSSPVQTITGGTEWVATALSPHAAGIKRDGTLWLWGCNNNGQLGVNDSVSRSSPVQTITGGTEWHSVRFRCCTTSAIRYASGGPYCCLGSRWSWGFGFWRNMGDGAVGVSRSSPVQTTLTSIRWVNIDTHFGSGGGIGI
jgi:alpha-tubulin suppressor-like RCC1 family protein